MKSKVTLRNVISYIQGNIRYKLFYSKHWRWLLCNHIEEQIEARIVSMNPQCYEQGSCVICGCTTTALQMANKACDKPCYPTMMSSLNWQLMKEGFDYRDRVTGTTWGLLNEVSFIKKD